MSDETSTLETGKYVYCIIKSPKAREFGQIGIGEGSNAVYTVHFGDLAAVVSDTPIRIYDPTRENVLAHEFVNETVMREYTVIPMSFGTLFRTEEDIVELLKSTYRAFDDVEDCAKVVSLDEENEEIRRLRDEINRNAQSSTYFARMQLGRLVEAALEDAGNEYVRDIHEALKPAAVASRSNKPIGERMILNAAFLVERDREKNFDDAVKDISRKYEALLTFKYTGPWPPYNFVNIKLKLEKASGVASG